MSRTSKYQSKRRAKHQKAVPQRPLRSSWMGAVVSFLKEYFLNHGVGGCYRDFDEELNEEGLWKKKLIWAPHFLIMAVVLAGFPFCCKDVFAAESEPAAVFEFLVLEVTALGMGISGIMKIRAAIKIRSKIKRNKD